MTRATEATGARHWIDRNLWAIMAVGLGLYSGYLTGQATMRLEIEALKADVAELRVDFREMHPPTR